jgi:regulator of replication initiation timing
MLKEERTQMLQALEKYKDRERALEEQFGKFEDIDSTIKVYKREIGEYKGQIQDLLMFKDEASAKLEDYESNMGIAVENLEQMNRKLIEMVRENENLQHRIDDLENQLRGKESEDS